MRVCLLVLSAVFALAAVTGCDAPPSEPKPIATVETPVITLPDSGPAVAPEPEGQLVMSAPPPAKELKLVLFAKGSAALDDKATQQLAGFARYLVKNRKSVRISGHTRPMADQAAASDLAGKRLDAVRRYFVLHDVVQANIETVSYAPDFPPAPGATEDVLAQGDRVELELIG